jgi:molybdopterin converting factor subunit 1
MQIRLKLFALLRDRAGTSELSLDLNDGATVATVVDALRERFPATAELLPRCAFAVNQSYAPLDHVLSDRDELAVIPPVSGG